MDAYDVAIVGYGPVGAVLANLLALHGRTAAVFEREPSVYHLPRAAHFDGEIMRVFQQIGVVDALAPSIINGEGMHFLNAQGEKLFGFDARSRPARDGWAQSYLFFQPELETALRERAAEHGGIDVFLRHEVTAVRDDAVEVRDLERDEKRVVPARFVVGCDGARSLTRAAIGAELDDLMCDQPWLVCDVVLKRALPLPDIAVQYCDPARPTTFVPMPGRRRRFEFMLLPGEDPDAMPARTMELLAPWANAADVEIERSAVYSFHALIARPWRRTNVFLAGDSAHQMPPFLGQGMCSGIRDASNLAWKIDAVLGGADDALLDTYEAERAPHVRTIIQLAVSAGAVIQTTDPEVAKARDEHFLAGGHLGDEPDRTEMPPLGPGCLGGPPGPVIGTRVPQPFIGFDDRLGNGWAVVTRVNAPELDRWFEQHDIWGAVVRPDRYVYATLPGWAPDGPPPAPAPG